MTKKRVFIIHGWDGYPEEGWFPWLKKELEMRGFEVFVPKMPDAEKPRIYNWVPKLTELVGMAIENTYFVGHSMGCQTIVRYLETLQENVKVGGAVFVAGFFKHLTDEDDIDTQETRKHWLETPINFEKIKSHLPKSIAIFSDNDPFVPLDNQDDFRNRLGSKIIIDESKKGHFSGPNDRVIELPVVLESVLSLMV